MHHWIPRRKKWRVDEEKNGGNDESHSLGELKISGMYVPYIAHIAPL
jgi:hypothetical protein